MGVEIAVPTWKLILRDQGFAHLEQWCTYIEEVYKKSISRDLWMQFLEFIRNIGTDYSRYSDTDSW